MEELRWYLEEYIRFPGAGDRVRAQKLEQNLTEWGQILFDTVFTGHEGGRIGGSLMANARDAENSSDPVMLTIASAGKAVDSARAALREQPGRWFSYGPDAETIDLAD